MTVHLNGVEVEIAGDLDVTVVGNKIVVAAKPFAWYYNAPATYAPAPNITWSSPATITCSGNIELVK